MLQVLKLAKCSHRTKTGHARGSTDDGALGKSTAGGHTAASAYRLSATQAWVGRGQQRWVGSGGGGAHGSSRRRRLGGEKRRRDLVGGVGSGQPGAVLLQRCESSSNLLKILRSPLLLRLLLSQRDGGQLVRSWSLPCRQAARPPPKSLVDVPSGVQRAVVVLF